MDLSKIHDVEVDGIDGNDYPDFCDAYIVSAAVEYEPGKYRDADPDELNVMNEDRDFVYDQVLLYLY